MHDSAPDTPSGHFRPALLSLAVGVFLSGCVHHVPIETFQFSEQSLRVGETDISPFLQAADTIRFAGTATLHEGTFRVSAGDYAGMEVAPGTEVTFDAFVSLHFEENDDGDGLGLRPEVHSFDIRFSEAVRLIGRDSALRVSLERVHLDEGNRSQMAANIRFGSTLTGSLAAAISGAGEATEENPDALAMLATLDVQEAEVTLRPDARIEHSGSTLQLAGPSAMTLRRIAIDMDRHSARLDMDARLALGEGTCVSQGEALLCIDEGHFELHGDYSHRTEVAGTQTETAGTDSATNSEEPQVVARYRLTTVDRPSQLVATGGQLRLQGDAAGTPAEEETSGGEENATDSPPGSLRQGSVPLERVQLVVARYECGGPLGGHSRCARVLRGDIRLGEGQLTLDGHDIRFASLEVRAVQLGEESSNAPGESSVSEASASAGDTPSNADDAAEAANNAGAQANTSVAMQALRFEDVHVRSADAVLSFEALTVQDVRGSGWGDLSPEGATLLAEEGTVRLQSGDTRLEGKLGSFNEVVLRQQGEGFQLSSELQDVVVHAGETLRLHAPVLAVTMESEGDDLSLLLSAPENVQVQNAGSFAIEDLRLEFRNLRLTRTAEGTRVQTEGLRLTLPEQEVLGLLGPRIPPAFFGEEQRLDPQTEAVFQRVSGTVMQRDLSRFRTRVDASGFGGWQLSFERGALRAVGHLDLALTVLADEREVELATCHREVDEEVSLPCFEDGLPSFCTQRIQGRVPYPCLEENQSLAEVFQAGGRVLLDISGRIESNAPARLGDLALRANVTRCDRIQVEGIPAALQRAAGVREAICERLQEQDTEMALSEVAPMIAESPTLRDAQVRTFRFDSDGERLRLEIGLDVLIPDEAPAPEIAAE